MAKKKRFLVLARNTRVNENGLVTGAGHRKFKAGQSAMYIKDAGEAAEIEKHYGMKGTNDVHVYEDDKVGRFVSNDNSEIHNYFFGNIPKQGGNERVKVRTTDGWTWCPRAVAEEEGYEIIPEKRKRRRGAEVKRDNGQ